MSKQIITAILFVGLLYSANSLQAQAPTSGATNLVNTGTEGNAISFSFKAGNGSRRILVCKPVSAVDATPTDGVDYNANNDFVLGDNISGNNHVVLKDASSAGTTVTGTVRNLAPNTVYHFAVFEYNGTNQTTQYLTDPAKVLRGNFSTLTAPGTPATALTFSNITGHSAHVSWTNGNGNRRVVVYKKGSPVSVNPVDLVSYSQSGMVSQFYYDAAFGNGDLGNGNHVIYNSTTPSFDVGYLDANSMYYFKVFEYNGAQGPVYNNVNPAEGSFTTGTTPAASATQFAVTSRQCNQINIGFNYGSGYQLLIVAKKGSPVDFVPADGTVYATVSTNSLSTAVNLGNGNMLFYNGKNYYSTAGATQYFMGLLPGETWYFSVFDYNGAVAGNTYYNTAPLTGSGSTLAAPTVAPGAPVVDNVTANSFRITMGAPGDGNGRSVLIKAGAQVDYPFSSSSCQNITANSYLNGAPPLINFALSAKLCGNNNYCVYPGSSGAMPNQFMVTNLSPGITYHIQVFENNNVYGSGVFNPVGSPDVTATTSYYPTVSTSNIINYPGSVTDGAKVSLSFTQGDGNQRLLIVKRSAAPTADPVDGAVYGYNNNYGLDNTPPPNNRLGNVADSNYIVASLLPNQYDVTIRGLKPSTTYHGRFIEFNGNTLNNTWYANSIGTDFTFSTAYPPSNSAAATVSNITGNTATINLTAGNGNGRFAFIKEANPVDFTPQDLTYYSSSYDLYDRYGNDNYCISNGTNNPFTLGSLKANTTYYVSVFEYNGSSYPVYKTDNPGTVSFTTATYPTTQCVLTSSSNIEGNSFLVNFTKGNGRAIMVVAKEGSPVDATPANQAYTANANFGQGSDLGNGNFVVYNEVRSSPSYSSFSVKNLQKGKTYYLAAFEYNLNATDYYYLTPGATKNVATFSAPTVNANNFIFNNITNNSVSVSWTNGNGNGRVLVVKAVNPVDYITTDYKNWSSNNSTNFGAASSGAGNGNYVVYYNTGSQVTITGLQPGTTYNFSIWEYNGTTGPVYYEGTPTTGSIITASGNINLVAASSSNLCIGAPFNVQYTVGTSFAPGNIFTAQLSDANGSFSSPVSVGAQSSTTGGNIVCNIPSSGITPGSNYLMRVVSSNPVFSSNNIGINIVNCSQPDVTSGCNTYIFKNVTGTPWYTIGGTNGMVMAINPNNQDVGDVTVSVNKTPLPISVTQNRYFIGRYFKINTSKTFINPVTIRLPFTTQELADYNIVGGTSLTPNNLFICKYNGPNEDCVPNNNTWTPENQIYISPIAASLTNGFYEQFSVSSFSEFAVDGRNSLITTLPLKLLSFTGNIASNNTIHLQWQTTMEENVNGFEIEWSNNTVNFSKTGFVSALNNGAVVNTYGFDYTTTEKGNYYFRIKMIDRDGKVSYSKIIEIKVTTSKNDFSVSPTLVKNGQSLQLENIPGKGVVNIISMEGKIIKKTEVNHGNRLLPISTPGAGTYLLQFQGGDGSTLVRKIVVQ